MNSGPSPPSAATIRPLCDGQRRRAPSLSPSGARLDGDDRALAARRRDEPLAAGQVPERARGGQVAVVGDPGAPVRSSVEVGAARAA